MRLGTKVFLRGTGRISMLAGIIFIAGMIVNLLLFAFAVFYTARSGVETSVSVYAEALHKAEDGYELSEEYVDRLEDEGRWAMLLNEKGHVVWEQQKPESIPNFYTVEEIASFSRWYLEDYPVKVWGSKDGLFVLGSPRHSMWKYVIEMPTVQLAFWPVWFAALLVCDFLVILLLSVWMSGKWHRKRDAARTQWIAGISHDVRTPLSLIMGYAGSLEEAEELGEEERSRARVIRRKSEEIGKLVSDLNLANRLEYSMEPMDTAWLSLTALVREVVVEYMNEDLQDKHPIEVEFDRKAPEACLSGDRTLLLRMLRNLIGNCIRHNPEGCRIFVVLHAEGRRIKLKIEDDGKGFTQDQLNHLRERSGQALSEGHGLGLGIVTRIAESHGADLIFSNRVQGGASCTIRFRMCRKIPKMKHEFPNLE